LNGSTNAPPSLEDCGPWSLPFETTESSDPGSCTDMVDGDGASDARGRAACVPAAWSRRTASGYHVLPSSLSRRHVASPLPRAREACRAAVVGPGPLIHPIAFSLSRTTGHTAPRGGAGVRSRGPPLAPCMSMMHVTSSQRRR
jgi:hypothetical protein